MTKVIHCVRISKLYDLGGAKLRREKIVPIRVNAKEETILKAKAEKAGLTLATYMRMASLKFDIK